MTDEWPNLCVSYKHAASFLPYAKIFYEAFYGKPQHQFGWQQQNQENWKQIWRRK